MNIGKFIGKMETNLAHCATVRHENNIDKFFKIHDSDTFGDSFNQMYLARETISRFAKKNGVKVDIYDARKILLQEVCYLKSQFSWNQNSLLFFCDIFS